MKSQISIFDTTLRDGQQTPGVDFSVQDKINIAQMLDELGVDYVEGGYPGANPTDTEFFSQKRTKNASFVGFGMTKRPGVSASNDPGIASLLQSKTDCICFVAKSWDYHVRVALGTTNDENIECIRLSVGAVTSAGRQAIVDCEHFFDGYKANRPYALECAMAAFNSGATWVVLCDTNGGTQPSEIYEIVSDVAKHIPGENLGIHTHDDTGQAVANSLAAIEAGARQIQGTLNGIGERCGNANLITIIANLSLKPQYSDRYATNINATQLGELTRISHKFDEILNRASDAQAPYVGTSSFATKAGIHASAILKEPQTYEHVDPEKIGNTRRVMVSDQGGKSNFLTELARCGIDVTKDDPRLDGLIATVKQREAKGYAYEAAEASFELLARRRLGHVRKLFDVESYRTQVERRFNANGDIITVAEAVVKVTIDGKHIMSVAEGHGPVNALDKALRKDLGKFQKDIEDLELVDFKVRILNGGTEAITRVLIDSTDRIGHRWTTIGVSENIIDASFQALVDSINYKLMNAASGS